MYHPKPLLTIAVAVCISCSVYSQTDTSSSDLNLGRMKLRKDFTQSITIKGEELERMPFANLHEAINAWSFGYYATKANITYVVDGIIVNDVNAWSVYDIEEVSLVQNALIQVNGAIRQQQLAVVTTRRGGPDASGVTVTGQSFLVKSDPVTNPLNPSPSSETNYFHQYQVSAYQKKQHIQFGLSANYLRDVDPAIKADKTEVTTPSNFDRFRLNGWLSAQLGKVHELSIRLNAVPQTGDFESRSIGVSDNTAFSRYNAKQTIFNPVISLRSGNRDGFYNEFTASYGHSKVKGKSEIGAKTPALSMESGVHTKSLVKTQQVLLMDQVNYRVSLSGNWAIEPSVNLSFRYFDNKIRNDQVSYTNGTPTTANWYEYKQEGRLFLLTPAVNLYYGNSFNIQGGLVANLSNASGPRSKKELPFVTTSVDIWRLAHPQSTTSLQFFGSYAQTDHTGDIALSLNDNIYTPTVVYVGPVSGTLLPTGAEPDHSYWIWQTGSRLGLLDGRFTANYVFEKRNFTSEFYIPIPGGSGWGSYRLIYPDFTSTSHHIDVNATVFNKKDIYWRTGLNATSLKTKSTEDLGIFSRHSIVGDLNSDKSSWTGGWVNRVSWKGIVAGLDMLYYFKPDELPTIPGDSKVEVFTLQNVYLGYRFALKGMKSMELYADCRNLRQDNDLRLDNINRRQYYGLGVKAIL